MPSQHVRELIAWSLAFTFGFLMFLVVASEWAKKKNQKRALKARFRHAKKGETRAESWLEKVGFDVIASQAEGAVHITIDGVAHVHKVRADFIVRARGRTYVAEVKTGAKAPDVRTVATRRQLLEYLIAFDVDGVLVVDIDNARMTDVSFPLFVDRASLGRPMRMWIVAAFGFAIGLILSYAFLHY